MASQYISFLITFILGITLFIALNFAMSNFSSTVSTTSANDELNKILESIKGNINDLFSSSASLNSDSLTIYVSIPSSLSNNLPYTISIDTINGEYLLLGQSIDNKNSLAGNLSISFPSNNIVVTGFLDSTLPHPYLQLIQQVSNNSLLKLGNE